MVWSHLSSHHACCQKHPFVLSSQAVNGLARCRSGKDSACQCSFCKRCGFEPWVRKIPWSKKWQPTPLFLPKKSHGERKLAGYSPWGCKRLNTTEPEHIHTQAGLSHLQFSVVNHFRTLVCDCIIWSAKPVSPLHRWPTPIHFSRCHSRDSASGRLIPTNSLLAKIDTQYSQPLCDTGHFCS